MTTPATQPNSALRFGVRLLSLLILAIGGRRRVHLRKENKKKKTDPQAALEETKEFALTSSRERTRRLETVIRAKIKNEKKEKTRNKYILGWRSDGKRRRGR